MSEKVSEELAAHGRMGEIIELARQRVQLIMEPATPTAAFLAALGEELRAALDDPSSVEHPELSDPEAYWEAAVKPQGQSVRRRVAEVVEYAETHLRAQLDHAETQLAIRIDELASAPGDERADRAAVIDDIATQCQKLHHKVAELLTALPPPDQLRLAHQALDEGRRRRATSDVEALKSAYLREAGGDEAHQRFAEQQWSETFADRVAHRDMMLRSEPPWRHQELAVVGHERTREQVEELINEAVARLQEPLLEVGSRLVRRYDSVRSPG